MFQASDTTNTSVRAVQNCMISLLDSPSRSPQNQSKGWMWYNARSTRVCKYQMHMQKKNSCEYVGAWASASADMLSFFSLPPLTLRNLYLVGRPCLPLMLPLWAALWRTSSDCKEAWMSHRKEQKSHQQPGQVDFWQVYPTNVDIQNRARRWVTTCNNQRKPPCWLSWTPSLGILWWPLGAFTLAAFEKRTCYDFQLLVKYSHNTYWHFKHKLLCVYEGGKLTPGWRQHTYTCKYASTWGSQWI